MTALDNNYMAVIVNMRKAQQKWYRITRILGRGGEYAMTSGNFYKDAFQSELLFGLDMWVMKPQMSQNLGVIHHRMAHQLAGMEQHIKSEVGWNYLLLVEVMKEAGLEEVETYVLL